MVAMYSDGPQAGYEGYDHVSVINNYFVLHDYGIALHAPLAVPVTNMTVTGNRWKWNSGDDKDYTGAVYRNTSQTIPDYKLDGNHWNDNKWIDGPYANQFLLPNNYTSTSDY
jgi:hypothetical protein